MGRGGEQGIPSISGYDHLYEVPSAGFQNDPEVNCTQIVLACLCNVYTSTPLVNRQALKAGSVLRCGIW